MKKIEELLKEYEIESIEEFEPKFYYQNLTNGFKLNQKAVENLYKRGYSKEELIQVTNYDEIGIVEYVASNEFTIEDNKIMSYEEYDEIYGNEE